MAGVMNKRWRLPGRKVAPVATAVSALQAIAVRMKIINPRFMEADSFQPNTTNTNAS